MGDCVYAHISIPSRHVLEGVSEHYTAIMDALQDDVGTYQIREVLDNVTRRDGEVEFYVNEIVNGEFPALEKFLIEHEIPFDRYHGSDYDMAPGYVYYRPDLHKDKTVYQPLTYDGDRFIPSSKVEEVLKSNKPVEALMKLHNFIAKQTPRSLKCYNDMSDILPHSDEVHTKIMCPECGKDNSVYSWNLITASNMFADEESIDMTGMISLKEAMDKQMLKKQYNCPSCNACLTIEKLQTCNWR